MPVSTSPVVLLASKSADVPVQADRAAFTDKVVLRENANRQAIAGKTHFLSGLPVVALNAVIKYPHGTAPFHKDNPNWSMLLSATSFVAMRAVKSLTTRINQRRRTKEHLPVDRIQATNNLARVGIHNPEACVSDRSARIHNGSTCWNCLRNIDHGWLPDRRPCGAGPATQVAA